MQRRHPTSNQASSDSAITSVCPHLGSAEDPSRHAADVSPEHRCYVWPEPREVSSEQQSRFCLGDGFVECPWLLSRSDQHVDNGGGERPFLETSAGTSNADGAPHQSAPGTKRWGRGPFAFLILRVKQRVKGMRSRFDQVPVASTPLPDAVDFDVPAFRRKERIEPSEVEEADFGAPVPSWRPTTHWECVECYTLNPAESTLCQQCGRVAPSVERMLLDREELFVVDGLKALQQGDEEAAHRCFAVATEHDPSSEIAWYWRARTGETVDEVINCLEKILSLNPADKVVRRDLELARARKAREVPEATVGVGPRDTVPAVAVGLRQIPSRLSTIRQTALELASIPSFALGLFCARPLVLDVLAMVGIHNDVSIFPVFRFPVLGVTLPDAIAGPSTTGVNLVGILPLVLAIWYIRLAFQLGEGSGASRVSAVVSGTVALAATQLIVANGTVFLGAAVLLVALSLFGATRRPRSRL
jgi:hypothetical protein